MADIYSINADLEAQAAANAVKRPRGTRPDQPFPYGNILPMPGQFGPTTAPMVSVFQVFGLPAANRCLQLIANGLAMMSPLDVVKPDGKTKLDPAPNIAVRPDSRIGTYAFWHQAACLAVARGNYLGILCDFDDNGYARQAVTVPPDISYATYNAVGEVEYWIGGLKWHPHEVAHVPGFLWPGSPWGLGVVSNFRRALSKNLEQQHMAADTYSRGSVPSVAVTTDRPRMDDDAAAQIKADWIQRLGNGTRTPAVLPEGWTIQPISWSPEDAQFLESMNYSIAETALMFNLDPSDLGSSFGTSAGTQTYANIEQRGVARVADTYGQWMRRFEEAWSDLVPGGNACKFNPENYLRLDAKTRAEVDQLQVTVGTRTVDELRDRDGLPKLPNPPPPPDNPAEKLGVLGKEAPSSGANPDDSKVIVVPPASGGSLP